MIRSGTNYFMRLGVWELLVVGVRFRPSSFPDYTGITELQRTYDSIGPSKRGHMLATVRELERWPGCPVAKEAIMFLEMIEQ